MLLGYSAARKAYIPGLSEPPSFWGTLRASLSGVSASGMPQKESVSPLSVRTDRNTQVIGRLRRGVNVAQARAELNAIQRSLAEQYAEDRNAYGVEVRPLLERVSGDFVNRCICSSER